MKRFMLSFLVLFGILMLISLGLGYQGKSKVAIDNKVYEELAKSGEVSVIVNLKSGYYEKNSDNLIKSMADIVGTDDIETRIRDGVVLSVTRDELDRIMASSGVNIIEYNYPIHAFLQQSLTIINATPSYSRQANLTNITGAGETICVIDSGINYTHPDLGNCNNNSVANGSCSKVIGGFDFVNTDADPIDDHGHGTHVAGIVAANGTIKGIAPNSQLVALKALNSAGEGTTASLVNSINWCVDNATKFNISVISMSLGTNDLFNSFCDSNSSFTSLRSAINNATQNNISVIAATGNNGNITAIAAPACIQNATSVGATNKDDTFASYSNRNNITDIFAPGTSINSTGGPFLGECTQQGIYMLCDGTSMSTPMVAATFALVRQFKRLQGTGVLNQTSLYGIINKTGKILTDSVSGLNFSRVDILSAIMTSDTVGPNVSLVSPSSNFNTLNTTNITLRCNATDVEIKNVSFQVYNSSSVFALQSRNLSGTFTQQEFNITTIPTNNYNWTCLFIDYANNTGLAVNASFNVANLFVTLAAPVNATNTSSSASNFTCNATSTNQLFNITFYISNSTALIENNQTRNITGTRNETTFNFTLPRDGKYEWNCRASDNNNLSSFSTTNNSITLDTNPPNITIIVPINGSFQNSGRFNVSINKNGTCIYSLLQGKINISLATTDNGNFTDVNTTGFVQNITYNVTYYCNDTLGNLNASILRFFTIDTTSPSASLSGPADNANVLDTDSNSFQFTVTDNLNISECKLIINGTSNSETKNTSTISSGTNTISKTLSAGNYTWRINCTDEALNTGTSSVRFIRVNGSSSGGSSDSSSGGGGGGATGGGGAKTAAKTYAITDVILEKGYVKELAKGDIVKFPYKTLLHTISINFIVAGKASITISSTPQTLELEINKTKKANLDSDNYNDLAITAIAIENSTFTIELKKISEKISTSTETDENNSENKTLKNESNLTGSAIKDIKISKKLSMDIFFATIVIFSLGAIIYLIKNARKRKKT